MHRLLFTFALFALTACLAPDGQTYTIATIDGTNTVQAQTVAIDAEQEFYRGAFAVCIYATFAQTGAPDAPGCHEFAAAMHEGEMYTDKIVLELWNWGAVQKQLINEAN